MPPSRGTSRRTAPRAARTAAVIMATAGLILLAQACSDGSSSTGSGGAANAAGSVSSPSAVSYSHCMRSQGVPNYPDPGSGGQLPKTSAQLLGISGSQFNEAQRACRRLLPASGGSLDAASLQQCHLAGVCPPALVQQALDAGLRFAQCMRSHGVPNWPDPTVNAQGEPLFNIRVPRPAPPQVSSAINECERLQPAGSLLAWG